MNNNSPQLKLAPSSPLFYLRNVCLKTTVFTSGNWSFVRLDNDSNINYIGVDLKLKCMIYSMCWGERIIMNTSWISCQDLVFVASLRVRSKMPELPSHKLLLSGFYLLMAIAQCDCKERKVPPGPTKILNANMKRLLLEFTPAVSFSRDFTLHSFGTKLMYLKINTKFSQRCIVWPVNL